MAHDLKQITGLPYIENGFTSRSINLNHCYFSPLAAWHFRHKPYTCDFDSSLLKRSDDKNE